MGDAIEDLKAVAEFRKRERNDAWVNRSEWFDRIEAIGFTARVLSEESRHCRVGIPGHGWIDFWPSSGRWTESMRPGGKRGRRGHGIESLLAALAPLATAEPQDLEYLAESRVGMES